MTSTTNPQEMLRRLTASGRASERKLRLFACACWARVRREGLLRTLGAAVRARRNELGLTMRALAT